LSYTYLVWPAVTKFCREEEEEEEREEAEMGAGLTDRRLTADIWDLTCSPGVCAA
jgi:hypothetical protein